LDSRVIAENVGQGKKYAPQAIGGNSPHIDKVTVGEIAHQVLGFETAARIGTADQRRIIAVLERLGWQRGKREMGKRWWVKIKENQRSEA
jgi:hypothetical protein